MWMFQPEPPIVGDDHPYHCPTCDVWGTGKVCWQCGETEVEEGRYQPAWPGGYQRYEPGKDIVYLAGEQVHVDDDEPPA